MYENRVELMGFLGKNPERKSTKKTGRKLAILSLATKTWWTGRTNNATRKPSGIASSLYGISHSRNGLSSPV